MTRQEAKILLDKYVQGTATVDERARLEQWYHREQEKQHLSEDEADFLFLKDIIWKRTLTRAGLRRRYPKARHLWIRLGAAAAILLCLSVSLYFFVINSDQRTEVASSEIVPGTNRATLTLADGRTISLSESQTGIVIGDRNIKYADGSPLGLSPGELNNGVLAEIEELVLTTPKGGTYQVTLSDGSRVWLNAASTIRYPSRFVGNKRAVEISGEAYFAVKSDKTRPFKVTSDGQTVEVLGTEFNISAYNGNAETRTTLVEGSVRVAPTSDPSSEVTILPGEQSVIRGAQIDVAEVEPEQYIAWKSGKFFFKNTSFQDMIAEVARWYDIEVVYEDKVPATTFSGDMKRSVSLMTVLDMLKISNIPFRIEGKKLIIE